MKGKNEREFQGAGDEHLGRCISDGSSRHGTTTIDASGDAAPRFVPRSGFTEPEKPQRRSESANLVSGADYPSGSMKPLQSKLLTQSPWILLLITIAAIFAVEAIEMSLFLLFDARHSVGTALVDASILTLVTFPILFFLLFRPLTRALTEHQRVESELRRSVETQMSLHRVTSPAIDLLDSETLLDAVIDEVLPLVGADAAWVTIPGNDRNDLPRVVAQRGVPEEFVAAEISSPLATCPVCGPLLDGKRAPASLELLTECPRLPKAAFASAGLSTHVGTLLRTGNGRRAILNIGWRKHRMLTKTDRALLATVVHQVGIALENAQLYRAEQQARKTAQTLRRASLSVAGTLDLDTAIRTLLDHLAVLIPYDRARVMLLEGNSRLRIHAMSGGKEGVQFIDQRSASFDVAENPVLQDVLSDRRGKIIRDTHRHVEWGSRMRPEYEHSWIGIPLVTGRTELGLYSLSKSEPEFFTEEHLKLAEGLAAPASIAIHNAILFERARRSGELLQTLSRQQVDLQEAERRAISRELHDETGQVLTTLKVGLRLLERYADDPEEITARVQELRDMIDAVQDNLHRLAADLRPASLDHLGLVAALRHYLAEVDRQHPQIVEFETVGMDGERLPADVEIALFRIVQEAVTNSIRHAHADRVSVLVERRDRQIIMVIEDDGVGLELEEVARNDRLGMVGMGERTEMLGGNLLVESAPGAGTTIVAEIPDGS
jgi:signal transduction histidine kinase